MPPTHSIPDDEDLITELFEIAAALRFMSTAMESTPSAQTMEHTGIAYVARIVGSRTGHIATRLWDEEYRPQSDPGHKNADS